jgi:hypothetical protein
MADLATQVIDQDGLAPSYAAAAGGGDKFVPGEKTFLHVKNTSGAPITVTLVTPGDKSGLAIADQTVSVPATTGDRMIGPLKKSLFADPADSGKGSITYSGVTNLTVAVLELGS